MPTLAEFLRDAFAGVFDLDGPAWRSLLTLLFRPGRLTQEYWAGRFSQQVSPARLYLLASAFYFVVTRAVGGSSALFVEFTGTETPAPFLRLIEPLMFVIVPAFGAIVMLVRRKDRRRYLAHLVFALHIQSAWFLLLGSSVAIDAAFERWLGPTRIQAYDFAQTLALLYLAVAVHRAYAARVLAAAAQAFLMMVLYLALLAPVAMLITVMGVG